MLAVEASDPDPCVYHSLLHFNLQDLWLHAPLEWRPGWICSWNLCSHSSGQLQLNESFYLLPSFQCHIEDLTPIPWRVMSRFKLHYLDVYNKPIKIWAHPFLQLIRKQIFHMVYQTGEWMEVLHIILIRLGHNSVRYISAILVFHAFTVVRNQSQYVFFKI